MGNCGNCKGNCGGCSGCTGCGGAMELTEGEIAMVRTLGQIPFLPVARKMGEDVPVYLEEDVYTPAEYSLILQCLEKRGLISIGQHGPDPAGTDGSGAFGNAGRGVKNLLYRDFCA